MQSSRFQANKSVKVVFDLHENKFVTENDNCCKNNAIKDKK